MAQAPKPPGGNGSADFVRQIVSDPKNVPDVMLLNGYLGASSEEGCERLYLSPDLSSYVEIPAAAILHRAALPPEQDSNGGVTLWVKKDAALQYKLAPAAQALANYFAGAIQAGAQGAPGAAIGPRATIGVHCATFNCSLHCATEITPCINTHANTCYCPVTHGCPTQNQLCQSQGQCTYIGCGHTLACTYGLLCAAAAPANVAPQGVQEVPGMQPTLVAAACPTYLDCTPPFTHPAPCTVTPCTIGNCTVGTPCTIGCTYPPQCVRDTVHAGCVTVGATCLVGCTQPPHCLVSGLGTCHVCSAFCHTQQPPCIQKSVPPILCGGFGQGQVPPGGPVEQRQAYSLANCSMAFCTQVPVVCQQTQVTPCAM